jgi:hypothetical protein
MRHEYILRTPDGDRPYVHGEGQARLIEKQVVTLPSSERFTVTKIVEQPDEHGRGGVVEARADRSR